MSAQRDAPEDGPRPAPDPHGLLVDTPFDSMREAQRRAERSHDGPDPECPRCGSINLRRKPGSTAADCEHKIATRYRCVHCGHHFDTPDRQDTLEAYR